MEQLGHQPAEIDFIQPPEQREQDLPAPLSTLYHDSYPRTGEFYTSGRGIIVEFDRRLDINRSTFDHTAKLPCHVDILRLEQIPEELTAAIAKDYTWLKLGRLFTSLVYPNDSFKPLEANGQRLGDLLSRHRNVVSQPLYEPRSRQSFQRRTLVA